MVDGDFQYCEALYQDTTDECPIDPEDGLTFKYEDYMGGVIKIIKFYCLNKGDHHALGHQHNKFEIPGHSLCEIKPLDQYSGNEYVCSVV